jgi:CRISPR-associated protein Csd1
MILQALYRLAQDEGLRLDPDFEPRPVAWLVRVSREGRFLGIEGTHSQPPVEKGRRKQPRPLPKVFPVPRQGIRAFGDRASFLYDKAEYALGVDPEQDENKRRSTGKLANRFALFRERITQCLEATQDEGVRAIHVFLEDVAAGRQTVVLPANCATNDLFAFVYDPDIDRLVTDRGKVRGYWQRLRQVAPPVDQGARRCLVSGEDCFPGELFPHLKKVPGGNTAGVALVSFNKNAFESYGWKGNANASISRDAAEACATALNRLLHPAYPDPHQRGQTLPRRNLRLSADTVVCYWSTRGGDEDFSLSFIPLLEGNPDEVKQAYHSIWRGQALKIEDPSAFFALTLTGTQGRVIVRDWFESTVAEVVRNLALHFHDLDIVRNTPKPKERELPPQLPLHVLLESLAPLGKREGIPAHLAGELVRAALAGTPYPFSALLRALERARAEIGKTTWADMERRDARAAIIKAVLNRRARSSGTTVQYKEVQRDMDPNNHSSGYLLGRLMAVIERMQQTALGDVNASVVDRFFSGASATPRAVFPRLLRNLRHHARKAKDNPQSAGTAGWLEGRVDEIMAPLREFPPHLDLEQQALFVLGYHHQRNWLWTRKEDRESAATPN